MNMTQEVNMNMTTIADGLHAMSVDPALATRILGGPFDDIDDVLDCCFDELMASGRGVESVFYVKVREGEAAVQHFPRNAFPGAEETSRR